MTSVFLLSGLQTARAAGPDYSLYQVPLPLAPRSGAEALLTLNDRAKPLLAALACGSEVEFALKFGEASEDTSAVTIAKLEWVAGHPDSQGLQRITGDCEFSRVFPPHELCRLYIAFKCDETDLVPFAQSSEWKDIRAGVFQALNNNLMIRSAPYCTVAQGLVRASAASGPDAVRVEFAVNRACLIAQVNLAVQRMRVAGRLGSDEIPCGVFGETDGDWDMTVRNLTRLAYLDTRYGLLMDAMARQNLQENLLTADGGPAEESYSLLGCGNTQESTGSSQDRADERSWLDDVGDWLEDALLFLLKLFLILAVLLAVALLTVATLGTGTVAVIVAVSAGIAAAGVTAVAVNADVPETENHLLMINTSKYLKNQFIIADLGPGSDDAEPFEEDQEELREWLLERMQSFLQRDFVEYNSRPYQRLSLVSILNIADFAVDDDLRAGAKLVLDYTAAKFAVGSLQGRRFVPFRRLRDVLRDVILPKPDPNQHNGLFDLVQGPDYLIGLHLLYAGQTQHLPEGRASFGAAGIAVYAATSFYHPESMVLDLAIRKDVPLYQRIRHETAEIYSSGRSFLISAGGTATGLAYSGSGFEGLDTTFVTKVKGDRGLALPTVLFLSNQRNGYETPAGAPLPGSDRTTLQDFIVIEGRRPVEAEYPSYDHNLCVWEGFACGINIVVPPKFGPGVGNDNCLQRAQPPVAQAWEFIDSSLCASYAQAPRFFIALYRQGCSGATGLFGNGCATNLGFFEIVDAEASDNFETFKTSVLTKNPPGFMVGTSGTYHSARGQAIAFSTDANQNDDDDTGVISINGVPQADLDAWPFAGGDARVQTGTEAPLKSSGDGHIEIKNPRLGIRMELDFRDVEDPKWAVH